MSRTETTETSGPLRRALAAVVGRGGRGPARFKSRPVTMIIGLRVFLWVFVGRHRQPHLSLYDRDRSVTETTVALITWAVETSAPTQGNGDSYSQ